jgi:hypothetical protein
MYEYQLLRQESHLGRTRASSEGKGRRVSDGWFFLFFFIVPVGNSGRASGIMETFSAKSGNFRV